MRLSDFDYELPERAIATVGAEPRDSARLLVDGDPPRHLHVHDLPSLLGPGDVVVLNDTRVLPARVRFTRPSGGSAEVLLLEDAGEGWWQALVRPSAKLPPGTTVAVADGFEVELGEDLGEGRRLVRPHAAGGVLLGDDLIAALEEHGEMPLPPYLGSSRLADPERYQTVYALRPASAAAPTAGLHLTPAVLDAIRGRGATVSRVELVVGLGTFRPIVVEQIDEHVMHHEHYRIEPAAWEVIRSARRVVAIGTTSVRALESAAVSGELSGRTDLFIRRPYAWQVVDVLMTNFHLPKSSLLVMIDAFIGPRWRDLYELAMDEGYRFLSFGDAMFLERAVSLDPAPLPDRS